MSRHVAYDHYGLRMPPEAALVSEGTNNEYTAGSYTSLVGLAILAYPMLLTGLTWDLNAGTYTITLDGLTITTVSPAVYTQDCVIPLPEGGLLLDAGGHRLAWTSAVGVAARVNRNVYQGDWLGLPYLYYNGTSIYGRSLPVHLQGYLGQYEVLG